MHQDDPHHDIRILQCNRMPHIKITAYHNATGCPKSRYPHITMQQDAPHQDIRIFLCNRMPHIKMKMVFSFLQRQLDQLNGRTLNQRRFNPLVPNDIYIYICICRTAQLTSRSCILNIYSTNILTEYFKHVAYSPFCFLFKMPFIS